MVTLRPNLVGTKEEIRQKWEELSASTRISPRTKRERLYIAIAIVACSPEKPPSWLRLALCVCEFGEFRVALQCADRAQRIAKSGDLEIAVRLAELLVITEGQRAAELFINSLLRRKSECLPNLIRIADSLPLLAKGKLCEDCRMIVRQLLMAHNSNN